MVRKLHEAYQKARLEINFDKTEYLSTSDEGIFSLQTEENLSISEAEKLIKKLLILLVLGKYLSLSEIRSKKK